MAEERITMKDARDAISELIKDESLRDTVVKLLEGDDLEAVKKSVSKAITDVEERDTVMKVLDAVEMETKKEEPSQPTPDSLKETIKDLAEAERRALLSFIEDSLKKQEEGVTPEQIGVMNSLAGGLKALYERVKAAVAKEPAQALSDLKKIETTMKKLIESYPYPYPAAKKEEDEPSEEEESEKNLSETDDLTQFTEELAAVQKSLKDAVDRVRDEQLQTIGEQVKSLTEQVSGLTKTIQDEVPIRKGLDEWISKAEKEVKAKEEVENPFGEEYEKAGPHDKLSMVFAEKEKRGITIRRKEEKKV